jgi:hypothetical protein
LSFIINSKVNGQKDFSRCSSCEHLLLWLFQHLLWTLPSPYPPVPNHSAAFSV